MKKLSTVAVAALLIVTSGPAGWAGDPAQAVGAVTRTTSTEGRFVVQEISGYFRPDAEVRFFDPRGEPVGWGKVHSVYGDEVYVDAIGVPERVIDSGFAVAMNYGEAEAKKVILARQEEFRNVKADARAEERQLQKEISKEQADEQARRERWQEDITRTKMVLDYQYSGYYYQGYPYYW